MRNHLRPLKVSKALQVKIRVHLTARIIPNLQLLKTLAHTPAIKLQLPNLLAQTKAPANQTNLKIRQVIRVQNIRKPTIPRKYQILLISRTYRRQRIIPQLQKR